MSFFNAVAGRTHWRRESWLEMNGQNPYTPPSEATVDNEQLSVEKSSVSFSVSEDEQVACAHQYFFRVALDARWLLLVGLAVFGLLVLFLGEYVYGAIMLTMVLLIGTMWLRAYFLLRSRAISEYALFDDNHVTISIDDDGITRAWGSNSVTIKWTKVNRVRLSKDFIFLMHDRIPLMAIAKRHVSDSLADFMMSLDRRVSVSS